MAKKELHFKTKNLHIQSMEDSELERLMNHTTDEEKRLVYQEMLEQSIQAPQCHKWYTNYMIFEKSNRALVGNFRFTGEPMEHCVKFELEIFEAYRGRGYAKEIMNELLQWMFTYENIYFCEAEIEFDNIAAQRTLQKLGFKQVNKNGKKLLYIKERNLDLWTTMYMCFGLSIGLCFGAAFDNQAYGMLFGMVMGVCYGCWQNEVEKKKREQVRKERYSIQENS